MSSATPLRRFSERCVCALTMPGMITLWEGQGNEGEAVSPQGSPHAAGSSSPHTTPHGGAERLDGRGLVARFGFGLRQHVDDAQDVEESAALPSPPSL